MIDAEKFKYARMNAGLGLNEVSKRTNISRITLYRIENGNTMCPRAETIKKLSTLYGKDLTFFYEGGVIDG